MPSLGSTWIKVYPEERVSGGAPFEFKTEITVEKSGIFRFTIPEELAKTAQVMMEKAVGIGYVKLVKNHGITSTTRDDGINFLKKAAQDYIRCEVIREQVIVYRTVANLSYYKLNDGTIVPNGSYDSSYPKGGQWGGRQEEGFGFGSGRRFTIGLVAAVYTKVTSRRESGDQITWERAGENCHREPDNYLDKLNSFVNTGINGSDLSGMNQIPYTEEAAKFFFEAMLSICKLSDRIESFFGSTDNVMKAIEAKGGFRLGDGKA